MGKMKTYILHATVDYTVQQKETGETYSATQRPTLSVEAATLTSAKKKAKKEREKVIGTDWWPILSLSLRVDETTVV
jgi:hypothetical protein